MLFPSFFNAGKPTYEIEQSLRFDGSSRFNQTYASSGNRKTFTISFWVKNTTTTIGNVFVQARTNLRLNTTNAAFIVNAGYGGTNNFLISNASFRDSSAWYHFVLAFDTTQSTASDRVKVWVNNQLQTYSSASYPPQNQDLDYNSTEVAYIGAENTSGYLNGYLAEYHSIDGSALTPTDFGEYDNNGVWRPKRYTGSYTGNSFYLKFDPSATNGIGHDHSGNGNHWTANGFFYEIGTPDYDDNWIGSTSGSYYSGSWENVFNGDVTVGSNYVYAYNNTATLTFSTALSGVIEVYGSDGGAGDANSGFIRLSDGSTWSINSIARANAQWHSFGTKSGITTITVSSPGGHGALLGAIRVDGNLLVNNSAKAGYDNFSDTPTTNYCTWNPLSNNGVTISNGNLDTSGGSSGNCKGTLGMTSGKWYWEYSNMVTGLGTPFVMGLAHVDGYTPNGHDNWRRAVYFYTDGSGNGQVRRFENGSAASSVTVPSSIRRFYASDVLQIAFDADTGKVWTGKNNSWLDSSGGFTGNPSNGSNPTHTFPDTTIPMTPLRDHAGVAISASANFGQRAFAYTPPTGFKALNTSNLPAPTVKDGSKNFNTVLYSGNGSTQSITGVGFSPSFVWTKGRSGSYGVSNHKLFDTVRGATKTLFGNLTLAEATQTNGLTSFDSDGFSLGNDTNVNASSTTFVAWNWLAGGSGSSNTDGTITSTVSANPSAGFSIVSYVANGTSTQGSTVGHGLGVAPKFIIAKDRDASQNWFAYSEIYPGAAGGYNFNTSQAAFTSDAGYWNSTAPTSTVFTIGNYHGYSGEHDMIAYCFAEVEGYSKFGRYTGNGNADGPFVYCGFKPAFVLFKSTGSSTNWTIIDNARSAYNPAEAYLKPNASQAETNLLDIDTLSNGFKLRGTSGGDHNQSGTTFIFAAFASSPFGGSGVSPATAR